MPLSASIFRRGGPKKELFDIVEEGVDDEKELDEKLADLDELLHSEKSGRELSAALWRPSLCAAVLVKQRKQTARDIGFIRNRRLHLHVEEAVFLVDRGDLLLFVEEPEAAPGAQAAGAGAGAGAGSGRAGDSLADGEEAGGGWRDRRGPRRRQRLLSVQEAMDLMISCGVPLERYLLFGALSRSGYLVMRHPSRWLLERDEQPEQVWGSGAWAACYGRTPDVPGAQPQPPMQQRLVAGAAAAAAAPGASAAPRSAGAGPAAMDVDVDVESEPAAAAAAARPAAGPGPGSVAAASNAAAGGGGGCRGWWLPPGPGHPYLAGVPEDHCSQDSQAVVVEERLSVSLRASLPNLRPFPTIRSAKAEAEAGVPAATVADDVAAAGASAGDPAASAWAAAHADGAGRARVGGGVWLGTPSTSAHLAFDVYKPGSFVSRYKGQFPAVQTHVAMCSDAPPGLAEMRAADAAAAAAAAGEGGRAAGVTWAAVLNGDIALYSISEADLLCLI